VPVPPANPPTAQGARAPEEVVGDEMPAKIEAVRALARVARLLERTCGELSMGHYRVLSAIAGGDERAARVAERLALGRPTVSAAVEALWRAGLVVRAPATNDQRGFILHPTPAGTDVLGRIESEMVHLVDDLCARSAEGPRTVEVLAALGTAIDALAADRAATRGAAPR
jgi:DNA-binding MarR family transcriptional regulator